MKNDLISMESLKRNHPHYDEEGCRIFYESEIDNATIIERRPQGEWIMEENNKDYPEGRATCSHCGYKMDVRRWEWLPAVRWYLKPNYCQECGADMRRNGL